MSICFVLLVLLYFICVFYVILILTIWGYFSLDYSSLASVHLILFFLQCPIFCDIARHWFLCPFQVENSISHSFFFHHVFFSLRWFRWLMLLKIFLMCLTSRLIHCVYLSLRWSRLQMLLKILLMCLTSRLLHSVYYVILAHQKSVLLQFCFFLALFNFRSFHITEGCPFPPSALVGMFFSIRLHFQVSW